MQALLLKSHLNFFIIVISEFKENLYLDACG